MKFVLILLMPVLFLLVPGLKAQKFTPKWYGRAETKTAAANNSYLCELLLVKKGSQVSGNLNYFFGQQEYSVKISGIYLSQTKTIELNPFNLITHFATSENAPDCQVDGSLTLYTEGGDSILYGQLNPVAKYRNMCPILTIMLRKEVLSGPGSDPDQPAAADAATKQAEIILPADLVLKQAGNDSLPNLPVLPANSARPGLQMASDELAAPVVDGRKMEIKTPALNQRSFQQGPLLLVDTDTITLHLYDNGQVDNDTISVFFNRVPVIERQRLSVKPLMLTLVLKPGENEIAMFAENLGHIPPNTALCLVYSGGNRYEVNLLSNLASNGTFRVRRRE